MGIGLEASASDTDSRFTPVDAGDFLQLDERVAGKMPPEETMEIRTIPISKTRFRIAMGTLLLVGLGEMALMCYRPSGEPEKESETVSKVVGEKKQELKDAVQSLQEGMERAQQTNLPIPVRSIDNRGALPHDSELPTSESDNG